MKKFYMKRGINFLLINKSFMLLSLKNNKIIKNKNEKVLHGKKLLTSY